jgi:hypothetical protein
MINIQGHAKLFNAGAVARSFERVDFSIDLLG